MARESIVFMKSFPYLIYPWVFFPGFLFSTYAGNLVGDFSPLAVGNKWVYQVYNMTASDVGASYFTGHSRISITNKRTSQDSTYHTISLVDSGKFIGYIPGVGTDTVDTVYLTNFTITETPSGIIPNNSPTDSLTGFNVNNFFRNHLYDSDSLVFLKSGDSTLSFYLTPWAWRGYGGWVGYYLRSIGMVAMDKSLGYIGVGESHETKYSLTAFNDKPINSDSLSLLLDTASLTDPYQSWHRQISGTTKNLNSVYFVNSTFGFAAGDSGTILNTTDGGQTWTLQNTPTTVPLRNIHFVDTSWGWSCGGDNNNSALLYTLDGGKHWNRSQVQQGGSLKSICFLDKSTGWLIGSSCSLFVTMDSGLTWQARNLDSAASRPCFGFLKVGFPSTSNPGGTVWILGYNSRLLLSSDKGLTWKSQTIMALNPLDAPACDVSFPDPRNGWIIGPSGKAVFTHDNCQSWQSSAIPSYTANKIFFIDSVNGWAASGNIIYRTDDGGIHWKLNLLNLSDSTINGIYFSNKSDGWAVGTGGVIFSTKNTSNSIVDINRKVMNVVNISSKVIITEKGYHKINLCSPTREVSSIIIYNISGQIIRTIGPIQTQGKPFEILWDGRTNTGKLAAIGIYHAVIKTGF